MFTNVGGNTHVSYYVQEKNDTESLKSLKPDHIIYTIQLIKKEIQLVQEQEDKFHLLLKKELLKKI